MHKNKAFLLNLIKIKQNCQILHKIFNNKNLWMKTNFLKAWINLLLNNMDFLFKKSLFK